MKTKAGRWLQGKIDKFMFYLSTKYDIEMAKKEAKWKRDYPELAKRIVSLEESLEKIKKI
jgi:endonuclease I